MIRRCASLVIVALCLGCAGRPPVPAAGPAAAPAPLFDFHVGFWVNLHQRLYAESGPRGVRAPLRAASAADQEAWDRALEVYRRRWRDRSLLTVLEDETLVRLNRRLAAVETEALPAPDLPDDLRAALAAAAPVYRRSRWADDERAARAFIDRLAPPIRTHGPRLAAALARAYHSPWPAAPVHVDVAAYAGPVGAYTVLEPTHITIASADPRHAGEAGLEILFHEASHALVRPVEQAIAQACAQGARPLPPTLWHAVLFWTTGEIVRRELGAGYVPYGYRHGLYTRGPDWAAYEPALARLGPRYLDGQATLEATMAELVATGP